MISRQEQNSIILRIFFVILLIVLTVYYAVFYVPKSSLELNQEAYADVISCAFNGDSSKAVLKFEEINFIVVPQRRLVFTDSTGRLELAGWFSPAESTIYIPRVNSRSWWILRHEYAHAVGFIGHPDFPFKACGWIR